jgi:hypothetical protein
MRSLCDGMMDSVSTNFRTTHFLASHYHAILCVQHNPTKVAEVPALLQKYAGMVSHDVTYV